MSIDVTIKQKGFLKKTLPLEIILGKELAYGAFADDSLVRDQLGESDFIAYHPKHIGRGFSVVWTQDEKKRVDLRLPQPSTPLETADFYHTVERIATYWSAELTVDGNKTSLTDFLNGYDDMVDFNCRTIKHFCESVLSGENDTLTLYSAMWPLHLGKHEAARFAEDADAFYNWLHEKQNLDASYCCPQFYRGEQGIEGRFLFAAGQALIFPKKPYIPFGLTDPDTGNALECTDWKVLLFKNMSEGPVAEIEFAEFLSRLPAEKTQELDAELLLISPFSETDTDALLAH